MNANQNAVAAVVVGCALSIGALIARAAAGVTMEAGFFGVTLRDSRGRYVSNEQAVLMGATNIASAAWDGLKRRVA